MLSTQIKFIILFCLIIFSVNAQHQICGKVTDRISGLSLAGVHVILCNDSTVTVTDQKGDFIFTSPKDGEHILQFNCMGYFNKYKKVKIDNKDVKLSEINVALIPVSLKHEELIIFYQ